MKIISSRSLQSRETVHLKSFLLYFSSKRSPACRIRATASGSDTRKREEGEGNTDRWANFLNLEEVLEGKEDQV